MKQFANAPASGEAKASFMEYQIRVKGHLDQTLIEWFAPLQVMNEPNGDATLTGLVRDQAELHGILLKLYNLNFVLLAVRQLSPNAGSSELL